MFILLVDDDFDDCELFTEITKEIDPHSKVLSLHDGVEALKYLNQDRAVMPDMIFLDINMPKMNGKQVFLLLQSDSRLGKIPIIIYSTSIPDREIGYYASHGVNCLVKPSTYQQLKQALSTIILPEVRLDT
jgi:CheY-like chemotaxis protein